MKNVGSGVERERRRFEAGSLFIQIESQFFAPDRVLDVTVEIAPPFSGEFCRLQTGQRLRTRLKVGEVRSRVEA